MARKSHYANEAIESEGNALTPQALSKQEFGRRLQQVLNERHWTQADLVRAVEEETGKKIGRDAVSTYINGRSFPTPASLSLLCAGLGMTREELFPNALMSATNDEHPAFEMKAAAGHENKAWVRVNRLLTFETAARIAGLISDEDRRERE